jgi:glycosyltransferase involved in cell wall biosynthesis
LIMQVVVINDDCVESGGAAAIALESVHQLVSSGIKVTLLTGDSSTNPELEALDVNVVRLGGRHLIDGHRLFAAGRGLYDHTTRSRLEQWIASNDTSDTVYHLHNWHKFLSPSVFIPLSTVGHRLVLSAHDYFLVCPNGGFFNYPAQQQCDLKPASVACVLTSCDKRHYIHKIWRTARHAVRSVAFSFRSAGATVLALHEGMVPLLTRGGLPADCIRVLRNPVTPWRQKRVVAERNRDVFFVGRLERDKGPQILAQAAQDVDCRVRIIGDGPLRGILSSEHPDLEFLGRRSKAEISDLVRTARCVVVPTPWRETFGLVTMEALTSGIPVIVSEKAFLSEEILEGGFGLTWPTDDVSKLSSQLHRIMQDDDSVASMSQMAFRGARSLANTPESWGHALMQIYQEKIAYAKHA